MTEERKLTTVHAPDVLSAALGHMQDRAATYDKPAGERSMAATVIAFNAITGHSLTEEQGWLLMGVLKMVRSQQGALRLDNYEDEAAYAALRAEAAHRERYKPAVSLEQVLAVAAPAEVVKALQAPPAIDEPVLKERPFNLEEASSQPEPEAPKLAETRKPEAEVCAAKAASASADKRSRDEALAAIANAEKYVDPTGRPTWEQAPNWANYLTQDSKGVWTFWQHQPVIVGLRWVKSKGLFQEFNSGGILGDWKKNLFHAPGLTKT